jgi:hypothetical protein
VKYIVEPQQEEKQYGKGPHGPAQCMLAITMCALCSEDPRFCPPNDPILPL